jgi:enamine deaminase RidA (YjgF/YER057c/UK114 family)
MPTIERIGAGPRMSQAVVYGDLVFLSGEVAADTSQDCAGQTRQILASIDATLAKAGSDKTKLLKANIWLADMSDFAAMNGVWDAWVAPGQPPARATVEAKLATPAYKVEIMVVAAR